MLVCLMECNGDDKIGLFIASSRRRRATSFHRSKPLLPSLFPPSVPFFGTTIVAVFVIAVVVVVDPFVVVAVVVATVIVDFVFGVVVGVIVVMRTEDYAEFQKRLETQTEGIRKLYTRLPAGTLSGWFARIKRR